MAAIINVLFVCPKCGSDMSSADKPERCPKCAYKFRKQGEELSTKFEWLKDPGQQLFELIQQDMEKYKDASIREIVPTITKEEEEELVISNTLRFELIQKKRTAEYINFLLSSHPEDIKGFLSCILTLMRYCISSGNQPLLQELRTWGISISKQIETLELFTKNGGLVYERNTTSVPGSSPSSPKDTGREGSIP